MEKIKTQTRLGGKRDMIESRYRGTLIEIKLPEECGHEGYSVECVYCYNKHKDKYLLSMWLKRNDICSKFKIESQEIDTQYIPGTRETIVDNICKIVETASLNGYFEHYIQRYEYEIRCFDRGNELYEKENGFITYRNE